MRSHSSVIFRAILFAAAIIGQGCLRGVAQESQPVDTGVQIQVETTKAGALDSELICESSGLSASRTMPGHYWTHNDSGNDEELFLIDEQGKLKATVRLKGIEALDIEDMCHVAIGDRNYLLLADVGDNVHRRKSCQIFLLAEPELELEHASEIINVATRDIVTLKLKYENGSRNCESVAYDPAQRHVWLTTKESFAGDSTPKKRQPGLYRFKLDTSFDDDQFENHKVEAKLIRRIKVPMTTAMDFSPDNRAAVIQTYSYAQLFRRPEGMDWEGTFRTVRPQVFVIPAQRQGEAICFCMDNCRLMLTSEKTLQPFWQIKLPETNGESGSVAR